MLRLNQIVLFKKNAEKYFNWASRLIQNSKLHIWSHTENTKPGERHQLSSQRAGWEREIMIDVSNSRRWHLWNLAFMPLIGICAQWWVIWNHALNIQTVDYIVMSAGCISFANGIALLHLPFTNYLPICTLGKRLNSYSTQWGGKSRLID